MELDSSGPSALRRFVIGFALMVGVALGLAAIDPPAGESAAGAAACSAPPPAGP
jgi:hypothetical protein